MTLEDEPHHWAAEAVDPEGMSLPALKASFLLDRIPNRGRVLEIGCGEGKNMRTLALHRPHLELHGADVRVPADSPIEFQFHLMDERVPVPDASFDFVLLVDVVEHVVDPQKLMDETKRLLRTGGRMIAFIPVEGEVVSAYTLFRGILGKDLYAITKDHLHYFSHRELEDLIQPRFEVLERRYAYHPLGQLLDAGFFAAARLGALRNFWWHDNVYYNPERSRSTRMAAALNTLLKAGNFAAWLESTLLARVRTGSAGLLLDARVRKT
jgi:SAM-dependent methyltransferase